MKRAMAVALIISALSIAGCDPATPEAGPAPTPLSTPSTATPAPDFTLRTLTGDEVHLADYQGRPVLINFWASWCQPCRAEMPEIISAYNAHKSAGLEVLAIDNTPLDVLADVKVFVREFEMPFPVLLDETGSVVAAYQVPGLPTSVFIDAAGDIQAVNIGPLTGETLEEHLQKILDE